MSFRKILEQIPDKAAIIFKIASGASVSTAISASCENYAHQKLNTHNRNAPRGYEAKEISEVNRKKNVKLTTMSAATLIGATSVFTPAVYKSRAIAVASLLSAGITLYHNFNSEDGSLKQADKQIHLGELRGIAAHK